MKIYTSKIKKNNPPGIILAERALHFCVDKPLIIQPSEIMKVPINAILRLPDNVVLNINTHPSLAAKVGEIFPALITLTSYVEEAPLDIPVRNAGRNPIHLMSQDIVAVGHLFLIENIEPEEFSVPLESKEKPKSTPPKKNREIKFEVKN